MALIVLNIIFIFDQTFMAEHLNLNVIKHVITNKHAK